MYQYNILSSTRRSLSYLYHYCTIIENCVEDYLHLYVNICSSHVGKYSQSFLTVAACPSVVRLVRKRFRSLKERTRTRHREMRKHCNVHNHEPEDTDWTHKDQRGVRIETSRGTTRRRGGVWKPFSSRLYTSPFRLRITPRLEREMAQSFIGSALTL